MSYENGIYSLQIYCVQINKVSEIHDSTRSLQFFFYKTSENKSSKRTKIVDHEETSKNKWKNLNILK